MMTVALDVPQLNISLPWLTKAQQSRLTKVFSRSTTFTIVGVRRTDSGHMEIDCNYNIQHGREHKSRRMFYDQHGKWYLTWYYAQPNCQGLVSQTET